MLAEAFSVNRRFDYSRHITQGTYYYPDGSRYNGDFVGASGELVGSSFKLMKKVS